MIGIYRIANKINSKCYIGSSIDIKRRLKNHFDDLIKKIHHSIKLQRAVDKYGLENFDFSIIEECCRNILIIREQYFIDFYDSCKNGYNISPTAGNCLGIKHTEETRKNMSIAHKGYKRSLEAIEKQKETVRIKGTWNKGLKGFRAGRIVSEETKQKISVANNGSKNGMYNKIPWNKNKKWIESSQRMTGDKNPMYGKKGELSKSAKLTWNEVEDIRILYSNKILFSKQIIKKYKISQTSFYNIINNKSWKQ